MRFLLPVLALAASAASADHLTTTYVCQQPDGHKAVQDHPCESSSEVRTVATIKHDPSIQEAFQNMGDDYLRKARSQQCTNRRANLGQRIDANRTESNRWIGNYQREANNADRAYIAENCTTRGY